MEIMSSGSESKVVKLVQIENNMVPWCDQFYYLGAITEQGGGLQSDITIRISIHIFSRDNTVECNESMSAD